MVFNARFPFPCMLKTAFPCELLSWEDMYEYGRILAGKVREDHFRPDAIVAIARGGYVPARTLCDFLMVSRLHSVQVHHWGNTGEKSKKKAQLGHPLSADLKGKNVLVVDDLADTGASFDVALSEVRRFKPKSVKTAALFVLENSKFVPDYYVAMRPWKWFVFPWNFTEDACNLVAGLFDAKSEDKKSLDMVAEELFVKHGIRLPQDKLKAVMTELVQRKILQPYWVSGHLMRWLPYGKPKGGVLGGGRKIVKR